MARNRSAYGCKECGYTTAEWLGRCPGCGNWNTLEEQQLAVEPTAPADRAGTPARAVPMSGIDPAGHPRWSSGVGEVDRVLGSGAVPGSVILIGGEPGVGKSTLLLQIGSSMARSGLMVLYVSAEESEHQLARRAARVGASVDRLYVFAGSEWTALTAMIEEVDPDVLVIDSIQTLRAADIDGSPGGVKLVRVLVDRLISVARTRGITVFLVGHVTKDQRLAGPKTLEHMTDVVLLFEGNRFGAQRMLRALKNRFGTVGEVGLFQMTAGGLQDVANPEALFVSQQKQALAGAVRTVTLEGVRPLIVEIQALVTPSYQTHPRRTTMGIDQGRVSLLLAMLEKHLNVKTSGLEAYVKVQGGVRLREPAADVAVALALLSSCWEVDVPPGLVVFGELGLTGQSSPVNGLDKRLTESARLGYNHWMLPAGQVDRASEILTGTGLVEPNIEAIETVQDLAKTLNSWTNEPS